ncbi:uncharacterized protein LOC142528471 isoform X1 [Primulina tabacum]|uniref:uncharacterized protein LOC142528471 isoform X1 n=1 Tax=Primulina tabacum TaxID=48773 RepID=UPI003F59E55C
MAGAYSSKHSSLNETEEGEILYSKDNVAIHPTRNASERIRGRLKMIKQGNSVFMTWVPYKGQSSKGRLSEQGVISNKNPYSIKAVPFSDIRSIRRHTPTLGWQYVIVVMSSGLAFPPLYFYSGGVRQFLATIKQHVFLVRSAEDANVFLVNDFQNPLQRTLSSLELPRAVPVSNVTSPTLLANELPSNDDHEKDASNKSFGSSFRENDRLRRKRHDPARDLSIQVLEKFSLVTRFARETTSQLFRDGHIDGFFPIEERKRDQSSKEYHPSTFDDSEKVPEVSVSSDPREKTFSRKQSFGEEAATNVGIFELINVKEVDKLLLVWGKPRQPPLRHEEWATFSDLKGRILDSETLRKRIFYGGMEHDMRKEVWKFLLGYHSYYSTYAEMEYLVSIKKSEYETLKRQWQSISPEQAKRFTKFRERKGLIDKDVVRTDRSLSFYDGDDNSNVYLLRDILLSYSFYNFDLGYCQGMSDLLSPIVYVMREESESFWCFVSLMERLGPNFNRDQSGMHSQLFALSKLVELLDSPLHNYFQQNDCLNYFFCFRWILIQFKREFEYEKTMRMWEVLWTHYPSEHLHLYVCVAILKRYQNKIIGEQMDFDSLLKFINELSGHIDLDTILRDAEALCICAGENGAACIPPGTPPSLPIEDASIYPQQDEDIL